MSIDILTNETLYVLTDWLLLIYSNEDDNANQKVFFTKHCYNVIINGKN